SLFLRHSVQQFVELFERAWLQPFGKSWTWVREARGGPSDVAIETRPFKGVGTVVVIRDSAGRRVKKVAPGAARGKGQEVLSPGGAAQGRVSERRFVTRHSSSLLLSFRKCVHPDTFVVNNPREHVSVETLSAP